MLDKNGIEMKTGDIVKIENAYFKNDNGYYFIAHTPGDPTWCGRDYSLTKIGKRGKISTAKYNIAFWPLSAMCNDRTKRALADDHNKEKATIEVIYSIDRAEVIAHFEEEATNHDEAAKKWSLYHGENSPTATKPREVAAFYRSIVARMKEEDSTRNDAEPAKEEPAAVEAEPVEEPTPVEVSAVEEPAADQEEPETINYGSIDEKLAERAWYAVHMGSYKANSTTNEYRASCDAAAELAEKQKKKVSKFYHDKIDSLLNKYIYKLAQWHNDYNRNSASCPSWFISGPANYPVRKHEKKMNRERTLWAEYDAIKGILEKIKSVGTGPIDLADPNAKEMFIERIEKLQAELDRAKAINAYYRKHKTLVGYPGLKQEKAEQLTKDFEDIKQRCPWHESIYPAYELTSIREKIKRNKARLEELERRQETKAGDDEKFDGGVIVRNTELDRLQILFDDIPAPEIRTALKSNGFRWSPKNKAWQRQLTDNAERALKNLNLA